MLEKHGCRVNTKREFFEIPLKTAISVVNDVCQHYECANNISSSYLNIDQCAKSGELLYAEALNEFDSSDGISPMHHGKLPYNYYNWGIGSRCLFQFLDFSEPVREKLELSYELGYKPAKGWLLFEEAWCYYYGHRKIKDNDAFVDYLIEAFHYNFEGAYMILAYFFENCDVNYKGETIYQIPEHNNFRRPDDGYDYLSEKATKKLAKLDASYLARLEVAEPCWYHGHMELNLESSFSILRKGINSNIYSLCLSLMSVIQRRCRTAIDTAYTEFCDLDHDSDEYFWDHGKDARKLAKKNAEFKEEYSLIVNKHFKEVRQCFEIYIQHLEYGFYLGMTIQVLLHFCEEFKVKLKKVSFKGIQSKANILIAELKQCKRMSFLRHYDLSGFESALIKSGIPEYPLKNIIIENTKKEWKMEI